MYLLCLAVSERGQKVSDGVCWMSDLTCHCRQDLLLEQLNHPRVKGSWLLSQSAGATYS